MSTAYGRRLHTPQPSLVEHYCQCGARDSDPTWHRQPVAGVSPLRDSSKDFQVPIERRCIFDGCVATWKHYHGGFPGGYDNPDDPEGPPIPFEGEDPDPTAVRDYNGAALPRAVVPAADNQPADDGLKPYIPRAVARRTDPSTSWEAARSVSGIRESQRDVLELFRDLGPFTDEEAAAAYSLRLFRRGDGAFRPGNQSPSGFRTRRSELVKAGLLRDTGERRKGSTGRSMIVWAAA